MPTLNEIWDALVKGQTSNAETLATATQYFAVNPHPSFTNNPRAAALAWMQSMQESGAGGLGRPDPGAEGYAGPPRSIPPAQTVGDVGPGHGRESPEDILSENVRVSIRRAIEDLAKQKREREEGRAPPPAAVPTPPAGASLGGPGGGPSGPGIPGSPIPGEVARRAVLPEDPRTLYSVFLEQLGRNREMFPTPTIEGMQREYAPRLQEYSLLGNLGIGREGETQEESERRQTQGFSQFLQGTRPGIQAMRGGIRGLEGLLERLPLVGTPGELSESGEILSAEETSRANLFNSPKEMFQALAALGMRTVHPLFQSAYSQALGQLMDIYGSSGLEFLKEARRRGYV